MELTPIAFFLGCIITWILVFLHDFTRMESDMRVEDRAELERLRKERCEQREMSKPKPKRTMLD